MTWMVKNIMLNNYLKVCAAAAKGDVFNTFKSHPDYIQIVEHTKPKTGKYWLEKIKRKNNWLLYLNELFTNDSVGNPQILNYESVTCSPSTLQYIGVLSNLVDHFGSLSGLSIIEIGGGYGGQCKIINDVFSVKEYHIVDLYEAGLLQQRYLDHFTIPVKTFTPEEIPDKTYDMVISNYALSEILDPLRTEYMNKVVLKAKHGYITCNTSFIDIPGATRMDDIEGERKQNYVLIW